MKVAAVTYVPELDWIIGPSTYHSDFLGGLENIKYITLMICILAIIAGLIISYLFAHVITKPLKQIMVTANRIAEGDLKIEKLKFRRRDELGQL